MQNVFLKPACDGAGRPLVVRDPISLQPLPAEGAWKPLDPYWARRIRDRDVTEGEPAAGEVPRPPSPESGA